MLNHAFLGANDIEKSRSFYDATMGALGHAGHPLPHGTVYRSDESAFIVARPADGQAANVGNGGTMGFEAKSYAEVDAWHAAGLANGGDLRRRARRSPQKPRQDVRRLPARSGRPQNLRLCAKRRERMMFTHVVVGTNDPAASARFYDATFGALGITGARSGTSAYYGGYDGGFFSCLLYTSPSPRD